MEIEQERNLHVLAYWARSIAQVVYTAVRSEKSGFPDITHTLSVDIMNHNLAQLDVLIPDIDDKVLTELFQSLRASYVELLAINNSLTAIVSEFFELPPPTTKQERHKLARKVNTFPGENGGPLWIVEEKYVRLLEHAEKLLARVNSIRDQILDRLEWLGLDLASL